MYKLSSDKTEELNNVLKAIYEERPDYFPHGLSSTQLTHSYLVKEPETLKVAGFVGWQTIPENNINNKLVKTGYYVIGILPEYRSRGFAKSAVSQIINKHKNEVDSVKAYIVDGNAPSVALAETLNIPYILKKEASVLSSSVREKLNRARSIAKERKNNYIKQQQQIAKQQEEQQRKQLAEQSRAIAEQEKRRIQEQREQERRSETQRKQMESEQQKQQVIQQKQQAEASRNNDRMRELQVNAERPMTPTVKPSNFYSSFRSPDLIGQNYMNNLQSWERNKNKDAIASMKNNTFGKNASIWGLSKSIGKRVGKFSTHPTTMTTAYGAGLTGIESHLLDEQLMPLSGTMNVLTPLLLSALAKGGARAKVLAGLAAGLPLKTMALLGTDSLKNLAESGNNLANTVQPAASTLERAADSFLSTAEQQYDNAKQNIDVGKALLYLGVPALALGGLGLVHKYLDEPVNIQSPIKNKRKRKVDSDKKPRKKRIDNKIKLELPGNVMSDDFYKTLEAEMSKLNDNERNIKVASNTVKPSMPLNIFRSLRDGMLAPALAQSGYGKIIPMIDIKGHLKNVFQSTTPNIMKHKINSMPYHTGYFNQNNIRLQ